MTSINGVTVIPRHNRPSPVQNTDLRLYFYGDGQQANPFEVCSVHIFKDTKANHNGDPSPYLDLSSGSTTYGQVHVSAVSAADFIFRPTDEGYPGNSTFDLSNFTDSDVDGSGIYRDKAGELVVVLRPNGVYRKNGVDYSNGVSATGRYFDIWTIRDVADSLLKTYIHTFELFRDNFYAVTSPLQIKINSRLINKYVEYGSDIELIFRNEISILNKDIDDATKNILRDAIIQTASVEILKVNESQEYHPYWTVSGYSDTEDAVRITSTDDVILKWNTSDLANFDSVANFGGRTGVYQVRLKVVAAGQTFMSPKFRIVVR